MPQVATGVLSSWVPGLWRRLSLISADGTISGLTDERLVAQLEELGIPRHQHGIVHLLQSWQRARVPPDAAFALWLLRERPDEDGCIYRHRDIPVAESSPAIRYVQLAAEVGETRRSDPALHRVCAWLLGHQLPDGGMPLILSTGHGETGQTARTLRALLLLRDPELSGNVEQLRDQLVRTAIAQPEGLAWSYSTLNQTVVTGATSLAITALLDAGVQDGIVQKGLSYLLAVQERGGGWAEVPGHRPAIHNTFNAVRAIRTAVRVGVLTADAASHAIERARHWFLREVKRPPGQILDHAFAVRAAVQLDVLLRPRFARMAHQLARRRRQFLDARADAYTDTAAAAIAIVEVSRYLDAVDSGAHVGSWRWHLPTVAPPFLATGTYFYELLYGAVRSRRGVHAVDRLIDAAVLDRTASLLLGTITALGIVDPDISEALASADSVRTALTMAGVGLLLLLWLAVKSAARSSLRQALASSLGALVPAAVLTWVLQTPVPALPALVCLIGLRMLVIDVVAFTANSSGLLDRLLPKT